MIPLTRYQAQENKNRGENEETNSEKSHVERERNGEENRNPPSIIKQCKEGESL